MTYSKKTRQQAIRVLDIMASDTVRGLSRNMPFEIARDLGAGPLAEELSRHAWLSVYGSDVQSCGDAAGLLRDGWCPGEPVITIKEHS